MYYICVRKKIKAEDQAYKIVHDKMYKTNIFISIILMAVTCIIFSCQSQKDSNKFELKGKLSNIEGDHFYVSLNNGNIDTIRVNKDGEFSYSGSADTISVLSMYFNDNKINTFVLVDKGWNIEMKGDIFHPDLMDVKGGDVNDDLSAFIKENRDLLETRERLLYENSDSITVKNGRDQHIVELKNINFELANAVASYVQKHPTKIASAVLINLFFRNELSIDRLDENINLLRGDAEHFPMTESMREYSKKVRLGAVGSQAPNFTLDNIKTKAKTSLSDFRGKYVLLSFVSSTCDGCEEIRPKAIEAYNTIKKDEKKADRKDQPKTEFITIVIDTETKEISKNIIDSVKWTILQDKNSWSAKTFDQYNIHEIPYYILISPQGTILERDVSVYVSPKKIDDLLKKK